MPANCPIADEPCLTRLAQQLAAEADRRTPPARYLLGIAGLPGAGKSTLADRLIQIINRSRPGLAALLPMDGFHYTNDELRRMGLQDRKGSPQTFDVAAYYRLLQRVRQGDIVNFPIYDRSLHEPVLLDRPQQRVDAGVRLIITEGNYLLLNEEPWRQLATVLDACCWLDADPAVAAQRLIARHIRGGRSADDARRHFERSDELNMQLIADSRRPADFCLRCPT